MLIVIINLNIVVIFLVKNVVFFFKIVINIEESCFIKINFVWVVLDLINFWYKLLVIKEVF